MTSVENMRSAAEEAVDLAILIRKTCAEKELPSMDNMISVDKILECAQRIYVHKEIKDEHAKGNGGSKGAWKGEPATSGQRKFMDKLGISYSPDITKGEASELIDAHTDKQDTGGSGKAGAASPGAKKVIISDGEVSTYDMRSHLGKMTGISYNKQYHNWDGSLSGDDIAYARKLGLSVKELE